MILLATVAEVEVEVAEEESAAAATEVVKAATVRALELCSGRDGYHFIPKLHYKVTTYWMWDVLPLLRFIPKLTITPLKYA